MDWRGASTFAFAIEGCSGACVIVFVLFFFFPFCSRCCVFSLYVSLFLSIYLCPKYQSNPFVLKRGFSQQMKELTEIFHAGVEPPGSPERLVRAEQARRLESCAAGESEGLVSGDGQSSENVDETSGKASGGMFSYMSCIFFLFCSL
jgi:hypothetical protein